MTANKLTYIGDLPSGDWRLSAFGAQVVAISPHQAPRIIGTRDVCYRRQEQTKRPR